MPRLRRLPLAVSGRQVSLLHLDHRCAQLGGRHKLSSAQLKGAAMLLLRSDDDALDGEERGVECEESEL